MKFKLINKKKLLVSAFSYGFSIIIFSLLCLMIIIIFHISIEGTIVIWSICFLFNSFIIFLFLRILVNYRGKYCIQNDYLYLKAKKQIWCLKKGETLILSFRYGIAINEIEKNHQEITIRKKGEKKSIPIRIDSKFLIGYICQKFICREE